MSSRHARFVTLCQQLLVLAVICAALIPATTLLNLEIVPEGPGGDAAGAGATGGAGGTAVPAEFAAYVKAQEKKSTVPVGVVDPKVKEFSLTAPKGARIDPKLLATRAVTPYKHAGSRILSDPQHVSGYGGIGVTWAHGDQISEKAIKVKVRTRKHGEWSGWQRVAYHDDHGPDVGSAEARHARPGTDEMLVGDVGSVQVKIVTRKTPPPDLKLAVVNPGKAKETRRERPALDTATMDGGTAAPALPAVVTGTDSSSTGSGTGSSTGGSSTDVALAAAAYTPKPVIYSRAQWGADESMRDKPSLHYYEVHAGFVHHTATANGYTAAQVPGIIRSIYAYHTQSKGWSDIGYNFLVDRFGRIWEGRYGGVDRPVVGAHTLGYNDNSFAASAIGNYEEVQPSQAMVEAYGALFAWKLSLHGVGAKWTHQYVTSKYFNAINGHRDAGQTACPGKYLYAKLPEIRRLAAAAQVGWSGRQLESNAAATKQPAIIVRRASTGQGYAIPILRDAKTGAYSAGAAVKMGLDLSTAGRIMNAGDWDRDGIDDVIYRQRADGDLYLSLGLGKGRYGPPTLLAAGFKGVNLLAAVGDMTGDGWPDLMGQPKHGDMMIYPGRGTKGLGKAYVAYSTIGADRQIGVGRWDGDGAPDSLFRKGDVLTMLRGNGPGGLTGSPVKQSLDISTYSWLIGISDVDLDGHPDLVAKSKDDGRLWLIQATQSGYEKRVLLSRAMAQYDLSD